MGTAQRASSATKTGSSSLPRATSWWVPLATCAKGTRNEAPLSARTSASKGRPSIERAAAMGSPEPKRAAQARSATRDSPISTGVP